MPHTPFSSADRQAGSAPLPSSSPRRGRATRWLVCALAGVAVLALLARYGDQALAVFLRDHVSRRVDAIFDAIGQLGEDGENYAIGALVVYALSLAGIRRGWRARWQGGYDRLARGALLMVAVLAAGGIITGFLKHAVARARPERFLENGFYGLAQAFSGQPFTSFPSSHAFTAFAVAATIAVVLPRWRWPVITVAVLVAASRLVNLDHYASDVLASGLIAAAMVALLAPWFLDGRLQWPTRLPWQWFRTGQSR